MTGGGRGVRASERVSRCVCAFECERERVKESGREGERVIEHDRKGHGQTRSMRCHCSDSEEREKETVRVCVCVSVCV